MGLKWTLVSLIQSPHSLYRHELGAGPNGELTQYELATELAYTFSGTAPSEALLAKAAANQLTPDTLVAEAEQLLATARGKQVLTSFFQEWLGYRDVLQRQKTNVPEFGSLSEAMITSMDDFIDEVIASNGGSIDELLTADFSVLPDELSAFYGLGTGRVGRPEGQGVGVLAQGAFLSAFAPSQ